MVSGSCLCGAIAYEVVGDIFGIWFCHCSKCRRANGSAFQAAAVVRPDRFRWLQGDDCIAEYRMTSGYRRRFCATCASPVPMLLEGTELVWLPVGGLDGDPGVRPTHHIFVGSKAEWFEIHDALRQFQEHAR
jgi:hypothetical protein